MKPSDIERAAYIAAHRIQTENLENVELACPGARRSYKTDKLAEIIQQVFAADALPVIWTGGNA